LFVTEHETTIERVCGRSEEWIFKAILSRLIGFVGVLKMHALFDTVDAVDAVMIHAHE
jgi:hypothetical protein